MNLTLAIVAINGWNRLCIGFRAVPGDYEPKAERIGMSPRHFTRVCLRETKMNPGQFVDRLRVEAAQQMIDSSNMGGPRMKGHLLFISCTISIEPA